MNKSIDIKNLKVARRYADALINSANNCLDDVSSDLALINEVIFDNEQFKSFFLHPNISLKDKKEILEETLKDKVEKVTLNFLNTLLDENRFNILKTIYEIFKKELDKIKNRQKVEIISAIELDNKEKEKLQKKLSAKLSKEIILSCEKQENIIGGLIVKFEDKVIDLSLKTEFDNLRKYI